MIVIDTSALFAVLAGEEDAPVFLRCLVLNPGRRMAAPTLVELGLVCARRLQDGEMRLRLLVSELAIDVVPFDQSLAGTAISAYALYGKGTGHPAQLNLGDCFAYALAKSLDAPLLYKGDDFVHTDIRPAIRP